MGVGQVRGCVFHIRICYNNRMTLDEYRKWCIQNIADNEKGWQRYVWLYDHAEDAVDGGRSGNGGDLSRLTDEELAELRRLIEKVEKTGG